MPNTLIELVKEEYIRPPRLRSVAEWTNEFLVDNYKSHALHRNQNVLLIT